MATMYVFNPTKEHVTRELGGKEYHIPVGKVIEVDKGIGEFLIEARGEMAGIPPGGTTWFGLVPITPEDKVEEVAKKGLENWSRLLNHRLLSIDNLIQEGTSPDGKQSFSVMQLLKDPRILKWKADLQWIEDVLAGKVEYDASGDVGEALGKEVKPKRAPKGVEIVRQMDNLDSTI